MRLKPYRRRPGAAALASALGLWSILACPRPVQATWSIILIDTQTGEIAVGSATCLDDFDLERWLPVVRVGIGAGCAQSSVDSTGLNRLRIWNELLLGTDPAVIIELLDDQDGAHQNRQYGIADTLGRTATFTGSEAGAWASGVTGSDDTIVYAIQGNVLTGQAVVNQARNAVLNTPGDLPQRLMAAMQAARAMGGDGRCSCTPASPTACGAPPDSFTKSAHIAFMIDARAGDADGGCNTTQGCASGDYFMDFNVAFQDAAALDPVLQVQQQFDAWRQEHIGRPDAVHCTAVMDPPRVPANGVSAATLTIGLRDWQDTLLPAGSAVTVAHAAGSDGAATISDIIDNGDGTHTVILTAADTRATDRFQITADDGVRPVIVLPLPQLQHDRIGDGNGDGTVDLRDLPNLLACVAAPPGPVADCEFFDFTGDGTTDLLDFGGFQVGFTGPCPAITSQPQSVVQCPGQPVTFEVGVSRPDVSYQWRRNGQDIAGATRPALSIPSPIAAQEGNYTAAISGLCGTIISAPAELSLIDAPLITQQPPDFDVCLGVSLVLCTAATGYAPLSYQWFHNEQEIPDATTACVMVHIPTFEETGDYKAMVTDGCGSRAESNESRVRALNARIQTHPQSQDVCLGQFAILTVQAMGASGYQWRKDGEDIPAAQQATFVLTDATPEDSGEYTCAVFSPCGPTISNAAIIEVIDCD